MNASFGVTPDLYRGLVRPFYMVARPGFFGGFGSWLDMFSPVDWNYAKVPSPLNIDGTVQAIDWDVLGDDMMRAIQKYAPESLAA